MNTEPIWEALFTLVSTIQISGKNAFLTSSRRLRLPADVPASMQPALFQSERDLIPLNPRIGMPTEWGMGCELFIYSCTGSDSNSIPSTPLNGLIDAVVNTLLPDPGLPPITLGGLVKWVRITQKIEIFEGVMGAQAIAIIPVDIMTPI